MNHLNVTAIAAAIGLIFSAGTIAQTLSQDAYQSAKHQYQALVARAEADYAIAEEKCDELSGNDKDVYVQEAKAVETRLKADAEARMTTSDAKTEADKTSTVAGVMERNAEREATLKALTQTRDVNYAVAKDKYATLESGDQARCKDEAKEQYSK